MNKRTDFLVDKKGTVYDVREKYHPKTVEVVGRVDANKGKDKAKIPKPAASYPGNKGDTGVVLIPIGIILALLITVAGLLVRSSNSGGLSESEYSSYTMACHYFLDGDYAMARIEIGLLIQSNPEYAEAYNISGLIYYEEGQYEKAIAEFDKAIALKPDSSDSHNNRGNAYFALKNFDQAILDYNRSIEIRADNAKAFYNRGLAHIAKEMYDEAINDFTKAIELSSSSAMNEIKQRITPGRYDEVFSEAMDSMEFYQTDVDLASAYYQRGLAYMLKGDVEKGNSDMEKALSMGYSVEGRE